MGILTLALGLRVLFGLILCCAASVVQAQASHHSGNPQRGQAYAAANCARCHAIGRTGSSPLAAAPVFRDIHKRYPVSQLAEAFAEGITTGHSAMPEFELSQAQIADLLAYLGTLER